MVEGESTVVLIRTNKFIELLSLLGEMKAQLDRIEKKLASLPLRICEDVMTTDEAMSYLRISKPTFLQYMKAGKFKAIRAGKGYRILKSELDRFLADE